MCQGVIRLSRNSFMFCIREQLDCLLGFGVEKDKWALHTILHLHVDGHVEDTKHILCCKPVIVILPLNYLSSIFQHAFSGAGMERVCEGTQQ